LALVLTIGVVTVFSAVEAHNGSISETETVED